MERLFTVVEQTFGPFTVRIMVALFVMYFLGEGFSKLVLAIREFSSGRRRIEREKASLELLKLRCDIEALKKLHGLDHIQLPEPSESLLTPASRQAPLPLARSFADYLAKVGWLGTLLLFVLAAFVQLLCLLSIGVVVGVGVPEMATREEGLDRSDLIAVAAYSVVSVISGLLGFRVLKRRLTRSAPKLSAAATIVSVTIAGVILGRLIYETWPSE